MELLFPLTQLGASCGNLLLQRFVEGFQLLLCPRSPGDVHLGHDYPLDAVVLRAVGCDAPQIAVAVFGADFLFLIALLLRFTFSGKLLYSVVLIETIN